MSKRKPINGPKGFTILYKQLGTISAEELLDALIEDIKAIQEDFDVAYITGGYLRLYVTNEYGDEVPVRRHRRGGRVLAIDTYHFRPACRDYDL